jgi:hypothetical protein
MAKRKKRGRGWVFCRVCRRREAVAAVECDCCGRTYRVCRSCLVRGYFLDVEGFLR